ncbi:hypothetical protein HWV62_17603 [Athelia sp. TMB]|nr:hypothetical protein HWV62_17603 [Athelia sp. TMB]
MHGPEERDAIMRRVLHRDPSLSMSATREEQLRDSDGPPPEDVPRKVMDIGRGAIARLCSSRPWRRSPSSSTATLVSSSAMLLSTKLVRVPSRNPPSTIPTIPATPRDDIPHVFVFPPEEERTETPPWCCFNPTDDPDSEYSDSEQDNHSDVQFIDVALEFMNDHAGDDANVAPIFSRSSMDDAVEEAVVSQRKERRGASVLNFMNYGGGEGRQHGARELPEDVVEVFKVRRSESKKEMPPAAPRMKRSKSLKMPFQKALRSIKNVGRSSSNRKQATKDFPIPVPAIPAKAVEQLPQEEIEPTISRSRSASPMLSRRPSQRLAQMFSKRNHSKADLVTGLSETPLASSSQSSPQLRNTPSPIVVDDLGVFVSDPSQPEDSASTMASRKSAKRFSVLDLHRVFTFSSSSPTPDDELQDTPRPSHDACSLPTLSQEGSSAPSTPSLESAEPVDETPPYAPSSKVHWRTSAEMRRSSADVPRDASFEMRLDSFHFDSLSFDPDEFDVSMALDGQRRP